MYLKKSYNRKTGRTQLFIVEAYRDKDKRPKSKVIKTLGYLDVLEKQYDDPIAYFSALARKMTEDRKNTVEEIKLHLDRSSGLSGEPVRICFGLAALIKQYNDLDFESYFPELARETRTEYNINSIFRFAACAKTLFTTIDESLASGMRALFDAETLTISDFYRTLDLITKHRQELLSWLNGYINHNFTVSEPVFYYFTSFSYGYERKSLGTLTEMFFPINDNNTLFGLFVDDSGLPLNYTLLYDSSSVQKLYKSFAEQLAGPVSEHRIVTVSGSMSTNFNNYIPHVLSHNAGYIVAYPLALADNALKDFALGTKLETFDAFSLEKLASVHTLGSIGEPFIADFHNDRLLYTERIADIPLYSADTDAACRHEKQILIYSPSYAKKCRADRDSLLAVAEDIIAAPQNYNRSTAKKAAGYIKGLRFDKDGRLLADPSCGLCIDEELVHSETALDGYIVIATSEFGRSFSDICRNMVMLAFTDVYFSRIQPPPNINGEILNAQLSSQVDFLFRYTGLFLCRLLERRLNYRFSTAEILESLKKCSYIHIEDDIYMLDYRDEVLEALSEVLDIDFTKKFRRLKELKAFVK